VITEQEAGNHVPSSEIVSTSKYFLHNRLPSGAEGSCKPEYIVSYGDVVEKILEVETKTSPDLIVLGARSERGIHGATANLPIAAAQRIVSRATRPVLTIRS
jgi:nucleotide-binding universal stress UspA family protein